jgi:hypothetical protein
MTLHAAPAGFCDAWCPPTCYTRAHRCEKRLWLRRVGKVTLCRIHYAMLERRGSVPLSAQGMKIEMEAAR